MNKVLRRGKSTPTPPPGAVRGHGHQASSVETFQVLQPGQGELGRVRTSSWGMEMEMSQLWAPERRRGGDRRDTEGTARSFQRMEGTGERGELQRDAADPATPSMLLRLRDFPQPRRRKHRG